ncbi:DUF2065 domain-containing protein [Thalassotalea ganghwensis]
MTIDTLFMAMALAFILEGIFPALFPNKWQRYVTKMAQEPVSTIRTVGITIMLLGAIILWWLT